MAIDEKEFNYNLNKVISWTNELSKDFDYEIGFYGEVFRQTHPTINGHSLYENNRGYVIWKLDDYELSNYQAALDQVLKLREGSETLYFDNISKLGRILSYEIGLTTNDRIMIAESHCFFDESDLPPIDTWFYLESKSDVNHKSVLYCWIPNFFEPIVAQAMKCDIMESCTWFN
jgi:hypothetical protein